MTFIDLNLDELLNSGTFSPVTLQTGEHILLKNVNLDPPQMGMFTEVNVSKLPDGTVWLDFFSLKYAPNKTVMDFMAYCYERWGLDSQGRGAPTDADVSRLKDGTFGRSWDNVKIVQFKRPGHLALSITLRIIIDNEDMSNFINQLAKGFVRSAVNQVGRDSGRVISNTIYNGQNYVPVSDVTEPSQTRHQSGDFPSNAYSKTVPFTTGKIVWLVVLCIFFNIIGSIGVLIYGIAKYFTTSDKMVWQESVPMYASDRRYKSGQRYMGSSEVKKSVVVNASPEAIAINKRNGKIAMIIGGAFTLLIAIAIATTK